MFKKKIEFFIKVDAGATTQEVLAIVEKIKKTYPNAKISVEMEV